MYDTDRMLCLPLLHLLYKTVNAEVDLSQVLQAWSITCCLYQHTKITRLSDAVVLKYQDHPKAPNWQSCWQCAHWADGIYLNLEQCMLPIGQMCFLFELFPLWGFWFGRKQTWFLLKRCFRFLPNILLYFNYSLMFFFFLSWILIWCLVEFPPPFDRTLYLRPAASAERSSCCLVRLLTHSAEDHAGTLLPSSVHLTSHAGTLDSQALRL